MGANGEPVRFFNRATGEIEEEAIYGEGFLRWAYETAPGRASVASFVRRRFFSQWYGWRMSRAASRARVGAFVEKYGTEMGEFRKGVGEYDSFNDFFYRELAEGARPLEGGERDVVFPADGRHLALPEIQNGGGFFVKGQRFDVAELLGSQDLGERYREGTLVLSRLCPVDYHRFHFPVSGRAGEAKLINGWLYSVSPVALRRQLRYLWENKRVVTQIETDHLGGVVVVEVGATCVGTVVQTAALPGDMKKGDEKGYFAFGGSAVITLFEKGAVELADDLKAWSSKGVEVYAKMGELMARSR